MKLLTGYAEMGFTRERIHALGTSSDVLSNHRDEVSYRCRLLLFQPIFLATLLLGTTCIQGELDHESSAISDAVASEHEASLSVETSKWNIPERLRISPDRPYGSLSAPDHACPLCLKEWQAIDIARAYLQEYPLHYLNLRAELLSDFPWEGAEQLTLTRTEDEWYFDYKVGLRHPYERFSIRERQFLGLLDPDESTREDAQRIEPVRQTWRVWYQTGWVEPEEIASLVEQGELPKEALDWGRQPLEEFVLVHAMTGAVAPVRGGRGDVIYFDTSWDISNYNINRKWNNAIKAAKRRAKLWIQRPMPVEKTKPGREGRIQKSNVNICSLANVRRVI